MDIWVFYSTMRRIFCYFEITFLNLKDGADEVTVLIKMFKEMF